MPPEVGTERRNHGRVPVDWPVQVRAHGQTAEGHALEISDGGIGINVHLELALGDSVEVQIGDEPPIQGTVRHYDTRRERIGVRFVGEENLQRAAVLASRAGARRSMAMSLRV